MTENDQRFNRPDDDAEGHMRLGAADEEVAEGDDTEAHAACATRADAETAEGDDGTEGHAARGNG